MASLSKDVSLAEYAEFINLVYGMPNERYYSGNDMLINVQRFTMRSIKGVRKGNHEKIKLNLLISTSWFISFINRLHISLDGEVWKRFPGVCSYCGKRPCACKAEKVKARRKISSNGVPRPATISQYQSMFERIYPSSNRTVEDAAIHLAEELGELSEAFHIFMGDRTERHFALLCSEAADFFSCIMGLLNSIGVSLSEALSEAFTDNCHVCHNAPCTCTFNSINNYKS
jgi:NTP pyrophosphatase (non-canonical NTP hydrolase)